MKGIIYIGSTGPGSGRSLLGWLLAESLLAKGIRTGFVHLVAGPEGEAGLAPEDPDGVLFARLLGEENTRALGPPGEDGAPSGRPPGPALDEICRRLSGWAERWDCLLLMGTQRAFSDRPLFPVSEMDLARRLNADVFLLDRYEAEATSIYSLLSIQSLLRGLTRCVIINRIPEPEYERERARMLPLVGREEGPAVAFVPEMSELSSLPVGEIARRLPAEIVAGQAHAERRVRACTLGTGLLQGPLRLFRQAYGRVVLSGPQALGVSGAEASGDGAVAGILLTGPRLPNPRLIQAASEANVPLLASSGDTFTTLEKLNNILETVCWEDRGKQEIFSRRLLEDLDVRDILECVPHLWK